MIKLHRKVDRYMVTFKYRLYASVRPMFLFGLLFGRPGSAGPTETSPKPPTRGSRAEPLLTSGERFTIT